MKTLPLTKENEMVLKLRGYIPVTDHILGMLPGHYVMINPPISFYVPSTYNTFVIADDIEVIGAHGMSSSGTIRIVLSSFHDSHMVEMKC